MPVALKILGKTDSEPRMLKQAQAFLARER
jgi:hypothetical protein